METKTNKRNIIYNEIKKSKGKFFYVEYIKEDKTFLFIWSFKVVSKFTKR